jgi:cell division protein FtsI/penicillin-binding protein 2
MAWGQGELIATPAAVARFAAGIANNGTLMPNRFVMSVSGKATPVKQGVAIAKSPGYALHMKDYMLKQSAGKVAKLGISVAGKTGTPERIWKSQRINDGWYVFFAPKAKGPGHIVVCVRLEAAKGSSEAVRLAGMYVIPELLKRGYIKSFGPESSLQQAPLDVPVTTTGEIPTDEETVNDINDTAANKPRVANKPAPVKKPVVKPVQTDTTQ